MLSPSEVVGIIAISLSGIGGICWIYWPEVKEDIEMVRNWFRGAA